jgi:hypothetical protein
VELCRVSDNQARYLVETLVGRGGLKLVGRGRGAHYLQTEHSEGR